MKEELIESGEESGSRVFWKEQMQLTQIQADAIPSCRNGSRKTSIQAKKIPSA